jgi:SpoU rRNA methylase family enzyme
MYVRTYVRTYVCMYVPTSLRRVEHVARTGETLNTSKIFVRKSPGKFNLNDGHGYEKIILG